MKVAIWGAGKMGQVHGQAYKGMGKDVEIAYIVAVSYTHLTLPTNSLV